MIRDCLIASPVERWTLKHIIILSLDKENNSHAGLEGRNQVMASRRTVAKQRGQRGVDADLTYGPARA
jgi:hypothetical protein